MHIGAERDVHVGGDVVGRDKITVGYTVDQVSALLAHISTDFQPKPFDGRCPYKGLDVFEEEDADLFFGREQIVSDLLQRVQQSRAMFVTGPSGSGKSSLVRAGVLHALRQGARHGSERWLYETMKPGRSPLDEVARVAASLTGTLSASDDVRAQGSSDATRLARWAEVALKDQRDRRVVLFVDQFEEVFTQVAREADRLAFLNLLTHAATVKDGRMIVLLAMRSDFVSSCAIYPELNALLNQQFLQVGAMQPAELVSAIAQPALSVGLRIDPDLIAQIINDMEGEPGALPLMQFALKDLFDAQQAKGGIMALTLPEYVARGGIRKALERHADASFAQLTEPEQVITRQVFSGLIQVGRGTQDTRRTAAFSELVPVGVDQGRVAEVIRKLADARLVTTDQSGDEDVVTIAHEKLIDAWPWLKRLVNENREVIALQNDIAEDAQEWDKNRRDPSYLYVGARLANAQEQLALRKIALSGLAQAFVEAGAAAAEIERQREETRRQKELDDARRLAESEKQRAEEQAQSAAKLRRRAVYLIGALAIALLLGVAAAGFGVQSNQAANANAALAVQNASIASTAQAARAQAVTEANIRATAEANAIAQRDEAQRQTNIAASRQLAFRAVAEAGQRLDLASLLSATAYQLADTTEARNSLLTTTQARLRLLSYLTEPNAQILAVAFSPDNLKLATANSDNTISLWDYSSNPTSPQRIGAPLSGHQQPAQSLIFTPDGNTLISGGADRTIRLWDVSDPARATPLLASIDVPASARGLAISADGAILAAASQSVIDLWDISNPRQPVALGSLPQHAFFPGDYSTSLVFSSIDRTLAVAGCEKVAVGDIIVTCEQGSVKLWDLNDSRNPQELAPLIIDPQLQSNPSAIKSVAYSWGMLAAVSDNGNLLLLWDIANPRAAKLLSSVPVTQSITHIDFNAFGNVVATSNSDRSIQFWNVSDPTAPQRADSFFSDVTASVTSLRFGPDGLILASVGTDGAVKVWEPYEPGMQISAIAPLGQHLFGPQGEVSGAAFSPNGQALAASDGAGYITLWNMTQVLSDTAWGAAFSMHTSTADAVAFLSDSQTLVTAGCRQIDALGVCTGSEVQLWDVSRLDVLVPIGAALPISFTRVTNVAVSPIAQAMAVNGDYGIRLWDISDRQNPTPIDLPIPADTDIGESAAFSPDGKLLIVLGALHTLSIWDVSNLHSPRLVQSGVSVLPDLRSANANSRQLSFDPSGRWLLISSDNALSLWSVENPQAPEKLSTLISDAPSSLGSVAFHPDGKMIAVAGSGGIELWDVSDPRSPQQLGSPLGELPADVHNLVFSPDGRWLLSGYTDGEVVLWDVDVASWLQRACTRAGRNMTQVEWRRYVGTQAYRRTCDQWPEGQ